VLGCNNYEVIDLGVMVPCDRILAAAREKKVDIIGLSGLITPSLDEMTHVAREMERTGLRLPLLIGGATTSRAHTAVKIAPGYRHPVVHVLDASRAVPVVSSLLSDTDRKRFEDSLAADYEVLRTQHGGQRQTLQPLSEARANAAKLDFGSIPQPEFIGSRLVDSVSVADLVPFIDWSPFFHTWELRGVYPAIFNHPKHGEEARKLFADAQQLLERMAGREAPPTSGRLRLFSSRPGRRRRPHL
jgi:5-methyltetrahydrofolate--homocysteine methyltransferase